jgi:hypothetical protein
MLKSSFACNAQAVHVVSVCECHNLYGKNGQKSFIRLSSREEKLPDKQTYHFFQTFLCKGQCYKIFVVVIYVVGLEITVTTLCMFPCSVQASELGFCIHSVNCSQHYPLG